MSKRIRCAIYTRKSTEEGLEQEFNSLDAQRESCEAFIQSQRGLGWVVRKKRYDDGGHSGGTKKRPALTALLGDIERGKVDLVVVYKVDRLTRSLMDFAKIIESFDARGVSFVSVTQQFNTANSMGRLTLNVLLSFAQFEREVTAERIRDKIAASKKKGMWMGGLPPLGYDVKDKKLVVNAAEADVVRALFNLYLELGSVRQLKEEADRRKFVTKRRNHGGRLTGGRPFSRGHLYWVLHNPVYVGEVAHKGKTYPGQHEGIVNRKTWEAVQERLRVNAVNRRASTNGKQNSLLTGLIHDERGELLYATYATKKGRRYRYYVSRGLAHGPDRSGNGWRLPAGELEQAMLNGIGQFLKDEPCLIESLGLTTESPSDLRRILRAASGLAERITDEMSVQCAESLREVIYRVELASSCIKIAISQRGLSDLLGVGYCDRNEDKLISVDLPVAFRRRGVESKIILSASADALATDKNLIALVAHTRHWLDRMVKGEVASIRKIAREEGMDEGDVSRFMPLAFLAPEIVEAILSGRQPPELTAERLKRFQFLPHSWEEQRQVLGFHA